MVQRKNLKFAGGPFEYKVTDLNNFPFILSKGLITGQPEYLRLTGALALKDDDLHRISDLQRELMFSEWRVEMVSLGMEFSIRFDPTSQIQIRRAFLWDLSMTRDKFMAEVSKMTGAIVVAQEAVKRATLLSESGVKR